MIIAAILIISGLVGLTVYLIDSHKLISLTGNSGEKNASDFSDEAALDFSTYKDESSRLLNNNNYNNDDDEGAFHHHGKDPEGPRGQRTGGNKPPKKEPEIQPGDWVVEGTGEKFSYHLQPGSEIEHEDVVEVQEVKTEGGLFGQADFNEEEHHENRPNLHSRRRFRNRYSEVRFNRCVL